MNSTVNVISIQDKREEKSLYNIVQLVLNNLRDFSDNTANSYNGYYKEFFKITTGKDLEFVTWEDLLEITYENVLMYREGLKKNNIGKTINIKIASINTLYKELYKVDRRVDLITVDLNKLPEDEDDSISYGSLTESEVNNLLEYCLNLPSREKPLIKKMFFETAFITAIRQGALLKLKWSNFERIKNNGDGQEVWVIRIKDKGARSESPVSDEFYDRLCQLKHIIHSDGLRDADDDRVFNVTKNTLAKTLKEFCGQAGIKEDRNIVVHSLKKASMDKVYFETRDINKTARHGHHKSVNMTYEVYQGKNQNLTESPSYAMFNAELDTSNLEDLTKEQLLEAIYKSGQFTINAIVSNIE